MSSAKAVWQALGAVAVAIVPLIAIGPIGFPEIVNIIVVAIGAYLVWNTKNYPNWPYGKALSSGATTLTTGLVALATNYAFGDVSAQQWWQLGVALLTTFLVYMFPNTGERTTNVTDSTGPRAA